MNEEISELERFLEVLQYCRKPNFMRAPTELQFRKFAEISYLLSQLVLTYFIMVFVFPRSFDKKKQPQKSKLRLQYYLGVSRKLHRMVL